MGSQIAFVNKYVDICMLLTKATSHTYIHIHLYMSMYEQTKE